MDELNQLPQSIKTKANKTEVSSRPVVLFFYLKLNKTGVVFMYIYKIQVKKMAIYKISEAVKEIRELTSSDSSAASRL